MTTILFSLLVLTSIVFLVSILLLIYTNMYYILIEKKHKYSSLGGKFFFTSLKMFCLLWIINGLII